MAWQLAKGERGDRQRFRTSVLGDLRKRTETALDALYLVRNFIAEPRLGPFLQLNEAWSRERPSRLLFL